LQPVLLCELRHPVIEILSLRPFLKNPFPHDNYITNKGVQNNLETVYLSDYPLDTWPDALVPIDITE